MSTARKMLILFLAVIVLVVPLYIYATYFRNRVSHDPEQLFYGALSQNLSQAGVTCSVYKSESGTAQTLTVQLDLENKTTAHSTLSIQTDTSQVHTEEIVVKSGDFLRYTKVSTTARDESGNQPDFSKILNKWIKADASKTPQLFAQTALGGCVVPLANLPTRGKASVEQTIVQGKVFRTDFRRSRLATVDRLAVREYDVNIDPKNYVALMKSVGAAYGLSSLSGVNLQDYANKTPRRATFAVDTKSGRLALITFTDETREVSFRDYGVKPQVSAPQTSISNAEANKLVQ